MEEKDEFEEEYVDDNYDELMKNNLSVQNSSSNWFTNMICLQAEIITTILISLVSPIFYILSFANISEEEEETEKKVSVAVHVVATIPSKLLHGATLLLKKFGVGILGAAYMCMVLTTLLIVSGILGFGLVRMWMEEPVVLTEQLYFDYADVHPKAVFSFGGEDYSHNYNVGVPVGHTMYVSLFLLMPESDFNRDIGVFQLVAEALSKEGLVMARSSHPCMLRFRSLPIRLMREFIMSVPLVLGLAARAGTFVLPQLYQSQIILKSQPPWYKNLVYKWKWTFSVWTSMYMYATLLVILFNWCRPLVFPVIATSFMTNTNVNLTVETPEEPQEKAQEESDVSESVRRWRQSRRKRKAMLQQSVSPELADDSASSISITREDTADSSE